MIYQFQKYTRSVLREISVYSHATHVTQIPSDLES